MKTIYILLGLCLVGVRSREFKLSMYELNKQKKDDKEGDKEGKNEERKKQDKTMVEIE